MGAPNSGLKRELVLIPKLKLKEMRRFRPKTGLISKLSGLDSGTVESDVCNKEVLNMSIIKPEMANNCNYLLVRKYILFFTFFCNF